MLYLHKKPEDELGVRVENYLRDKSAAFRMRTSDEEESYIMENDIKIKGEQAVWRYLESYGNLLSAERSISADACYIDPNTGKAC
ncbi:MAG: hypothetical protein AAF363_13755 [Bacteroidota bacterium]